MMHRQWNKVSASFPVIWSIHSCIDIAVAT